VTLCALGLVRNEWEPAENEHFPTRRGQNGGVLKLYATINQGNYASCDPRDTATTTMAMGDDVSDVDGDGATGNEVDNDGDGTTGEDNDADDDGDDGDDGDGDSAMGSGAMGYNDDDDGDGRRRDRRRRRR